MKFSDLCASAEVADIRGEASVEVSSLTFDSRNVDKGACFFALCGTLCDGHDFIDAAVAKGASAVVCRHLPEHLAAGVAYAAVEDTDAVMAAMASAFYGNPSSELTLVGITGTNGKTTTATLLFDMFRAMGYGAGLISTVSYRINDREMESTHTTPDTIRLNAMMREMADAGCEYCFMEVSSHAIVQQRIGGLHFKGGIFTNITHDHLDYHKTFAEYIRAKKMFFDSLPREAFAITNIDDRNGSVMTQNTRAEVHTVSMRQMADYRCRIVEQHADGMLLRFDGDEVWVRFIGRFNAANLLSVYAAALSLGADRQEVLRLLSTLAPVSGRFETLHSADGVTAVVDYAHTPDALENVLRTISEIRREGHKIITVCGCGGDRDRTKRPEMARIAVKYSDRTVFTSDNPRMERPEDILQEMVDGVEPSAQYLRITDRAEAIKTAVLLAASGDIILVAGKGHETYQIIGTQKHHFDDREQIRSAFDARK